jgi:2-phospho-L-lactate guanylyltransferase
VQGTISAFDDVTRDGRVLLDDGVELTFPASALDGTRLRFLRPGQRVRLETVGSGAEQSVVRLQILTLHP